MNFDLVSRACFEPVKHSPLARLDDLIAWPKVRAIVDEACAARGSASTGRPAYSNEQLMRLAVLKMLHVCSAADACMALRCRLDWRLFCRFDLLADLPEASTLNRFIRTLADGTEGVDQLLFGKAGRIYEVVLASTFSRGYRLQTAHSALPYPTLRRCAAMAPESDES